MAAVELVVKLFCRRKTPITATIAGVRTFVRCDISSVSHRSQSLIKNFYF